MSFPSFFTKYKPPKSVPMEFKQASLTRQEFAAEADINNIMKRYSAGMPIPAGTRTPIYGDFSEVPDYQSAFDIVSHAQDSFASLPSEVRKRFDNDPGKLMQFLSDANNRDEAIKLGLLKSPEKSSETAPETAPAKSSESVSVPEKGEGQ